MKKHILWIVPFVLYLFAVLLSNTANYFNRTWFNVRHAILFGVIIYVLLLSLYFVYRFFSKRYTTNKPLKYILMISLSTIAIVTTIAISNLQVKYIEAFEVPQKKDCTYYDVFGNVIYKNMVEICPTLDIVSMDENTLSFTVNEHSEQVIYENLEGQVGYSYYDGSIDVTVTATILYRDMYINSYSYHTHKETKNLTSGVSKVTITERTLDSHLTVRETLSQTHTFKEQNYLSTDEDVLPFNDVEPTVWEYVSIFHESDDYKNNIIFKEIQYTSEGVGEETTFAIGEVSLVNDPLIRVNIYDDGNPFSTTKTYTDYSFQYDMIEIKNSYETDSATVERQYESRELQYHDFTNQVIHNDVDEITINDLYFFETFHVDLNYASNLDLDFTYTVTSIQDNLYFDDSDDYFHKITFTDYGIVVEEYIVKTFDVSELFEENKESSQIMGNYLSYILGLDTYDFLDVYDSKKMMETPGHLGQFHFYQHNQLVEFPLIGVHERFD